MRLLESVNPDWVTPGWIPLVLVLLVGVVCVGLYLNMRKHVRAARANDPQWRAEPERPAPGAEES